MINLARTNPHAAEVVSLYEQSGEGITSIAEGLGMEEEVVKTILYNGSEVYRKELRNKEIHPVDRLTVEDTKEVIEVLQGLMRHQLEENPQLACRAAIALLKDARNNYNNRGDSIKNTTKVVVENLQIVNSEIRKRRRVKEGRAGVIEAKIIDVAGKEAKEKVTLLDSLLAPAGV